jgi:hypothetical protein
MKRCAQCEGKLGLGVRARNLWNGLWWAHVHFCSTHVKLVTSWSDTTPTHIAGAPSSLATVRGADRFPLRHWPKAEPSEGYTLGS